MSVDAATTVTAIFSGPLLTVTKAGDGTGTVVSDPLGVSCGVDCSEDYEADTVVTLTASFGTSTVAGGTGSTFAGFTGCATTPTARICMVTMDQARTVTATFVDNPTLTLTKAGTGTGTVTSSPAGLNCGTTCVRDFAIGSTVTLTATPAAGSVFGGFSGCTTTPTDNTCTVAVDQAKAVTATFTLIEYPLPAPPPPPAPPAPPPPPAAPAGKFTAKLSLARARIERGNRVLDVLAPITSRASGRVRVELHAAGRRFRFTAPIDPVNGRIRFRQRIPAAQAQMGTGIITITTPATPTRGRRACGCGPRSGLRC